MRLYHLTTLECLSRILLEGLIPKHGLNSIIASDDLEAIYLSKQEHLPYWRILLGYTFIVEVDIDESYTIKCKHYDLYDEYICEVPIPQSCIESVSTLVYIDQSAMCNLCISYTHSLSTLILNTIKDYYRNNKLSYTDDLISYIEFFLKVSERLDFSVVPSAELRNALKEAGEDGEYTFLDSYLDTDRKLYQQFMFFDDPLTQDVRKRLYELIINIYSDCLDLNTGGWTG